MTLQCVEGREAWGIHPQLCEATANSEKMCGTVMRPEPRPVQQLRTEHRPSRSSLGPPGQFAAAPPGASEIQSCFRKARAKRRSPDALTSALAPASPRGPTPLAQSPSQAGGLVLVPGPSPHCHLRPCPPSFQDTHPQSSCQGRADAQDHGPWSACSFHTSFPCS